MKPGPPTYSSRDGSVSAGSRFVAVEAKAVTVPSSLVDGENAWPFAFALPTWSTTPMLLSVSERS